MVVVSALEVTAVAEIPFLLGFLDCMGIEKRQEKQQSKSNRANFELRKLFLRCSISKKQRRVTLLC